MSTTTTNDATPITRPLRPPKPPKPHPSIAALSAFLSNFPQTTTQPPPLPSKLRYDIYGPLLLLPPTSPLTSPPWSTFISSLPPQSQSSLYATLAKSLNVTHIAINSPIPSKSVDHQNAIRAPQITPLYGSFGPLDSTDFEEVFWTSTVQHGVFQTWCPLHTMFSRGNITEKNRIYGLVDTQLKELRRSGVKKKVSAVDLFVGIGYFAFSYLKAGVDVVYGWDINRWSIEGCRRGAIGNKWGVRVNREGSDCENVGAGEERLVIFEESNEYAIDRLRRIKQRTTEAGREWVHILHVNLGLLPTSSGAYKTALEVLGLNNGGGEAWIHVHENVAKEDVDEMKDGIIKKFEQLKGEVGGMEEVRIEVEHVEFVKSWAPGVWHCVFDVKVS
ncbi:hypothetical protein TWF192_009812 [Orbilia oligospora]|uniref:tRNA wybutosine-synthesizing protein 2 n=1 Tax=Orbilia oligospora TaxID=2813651 RepID=A0A6G1MKW7_ORBOL|nr:hypothetical protein TWF191_010239 [Orbilia oligospora]KAF3260534.1 hypothetical protein TWF192_009812 [Orbilia oligospora]